MPALKPDNLGKFIRNIYRVIQHQEKSFVELLLDSLVSLAHLTGVSSVMPFLY